tara:strand:+ start:3859 stop:6150 length:2292 start_codon:yes stop_codon:yes gene_type:complete
VSKTNKKWSHEVQAPTHLQAIKIIGGAEQTAQQRWRNLKQNTSNVRDVLWAKLADETLDPVLSSPCSTEELKDIIQRISDGVRLNTLQRLHLISGFLLHDGVQISFIGKGLLVNGRAMPSAVPIVSLLNVLASKSVRTGWDLTKLFVAFGSLNTTKIATIDPRRAPRQYRRRNIHHSLQKPGASALFTWIQWMAEEHLTPPENYSLNPIGVWARDIRERLGMLSREKFEQSLVDAFKNHPQGLQQLDGYPWLERWHSYLATNQHESLLEWPFVIVGDKIKILVRTKNNASRKTAIPDEPGIWAFLLASAMSPITSDAGELLYALQCNWTCQTVTGREISAPLRRSIQFLREVIDGNSDRVFVHEEHILVIGRLGHFYDVRIGRGAHNAPFIIESIDSLESRITHPICIHDGAFHSTVPLGDTLVSVILSLLDDINTSSEIDSLRHHVAFNSPLGFPPKVTEKHLRFFNQNDIQLFKRIVRESRTSDPGNIHWLPQNPFNPDDVVGMRRRNLMHLYHRNNANNHRMRLREAENNREQRTYRTEMLVEHALAANSALPHPQFIELWHKSFAEMIQDVRGPLLPHLYHDVRGRNEWMFIRNFGRDQNDHPIGDLRNGERRYCEIFPRIWEALMRHPIGATFRMGVLDGGTLTFENCHLAVTIRTAQERRMIRRFSALLGYVEHGRHENNIEFIRRDHPRNHARRDLTLLLNRAQGTLGARGAPPWWWHYAEVIEAPMEAPPFEFRWELEQDLRDQNPRDRRHGYVP